MIEERLEEVILREVGVVRLLRRKVVRAVE